MVQSVTLGFMQSAIVGQGYLYVCVLKIVCYWMLVCWCVCVLLMPVHMYACLCMYWHASLYIYTYFRCLLDGKRRRGTKEESVRRVGEGGRNGLLQSEFLFPSDFLVVKGLFWFEYEMSVFWGNFVEWWWWWLKLKSSSYYLFFFLMWYDIYGQVIKIIGFGYLLL